ncbi:MAG: gliding motility-associated protein GldE [Flavobacteriaceae bacterium]|nr:gliding motility-associated protein GldE [Pelagibacterales bacterium]MBT4709618.1 gliding motility-associated protein GldE [Flavobacteriaceae bacterium]MBT4959368.1 gliding motility-associated protein GldE [Flavobacteriaceae bacterium]
MNLITILLLLDTYTLVFKIILIILLLIFSALISGSEVAFFSLSSTDIKKANISKSKSLKLVHNLRNKPKRLLAALLVSNNFINIAIVLLFSSFGDAMYFSSLPFWANFIIEVGIITLFILLFGEILPKVYANRNPVSFSKKMALPIQILDKYIFFFLTIPMSMMTEFIQKKLVFKSTNLSVDKLSDALELTDKTETSKDEQKILKGIVSFGSIETKQVMKPRIDVFSVSKDLTFDELIKQVREEGYSRIPVFEEKIDKVIGVIYLKDLFPFLNNKDYKWNELIREPYFVPENKKLDDLLNEFQQLKIHLAIVVDEYGGNSGIITMEDIVEEIVGGLSDKFYQEDLSYYKIDSNNYIFDGKTNLKDFYRAIKIKNEIIFENKKGESETIAGFILEQFGYFPKKGSVLKVNNVKFKIEEIDRKRIKKIKITLKK